MRAIFSLRTIALPAILLACISSLLGCSGASSSATTPAPTGPGTLSFAASTTAAAQIAGTAVIPVSRTGGSTGAVTVTYATTNGTATAGTDYTTTTGTLSWADGDSSTKNIYIPLATTVNFYGIRNLTLTLTAPTGSATLATSTTLVAIAGGLATPVPGTLAFASTTASASVVTGSVTLTVNRTIGTSGTASIHYATANGTASAGVDYTTTSGTLNWADGDAASKTISIPLNSSVSFSGTLTFTVTLSAPAGSLGTPTLGTAATSTVSITTNPVPGTLAFMATTTAATQSSGTASIPVARTIGTLGAVGVSYATANGTAIAGTDYTSTSGTLSWANGDSANKTINVPISNTLNFNGTKTFTVTLSTPTGSATLGTPVTNTATITGAGMVAPSTCTQYNFAPWKVQLPIDSSGGAGGTNGIQFAATEESSAQIRAGFVDNFFYADSSCNLIFTAPVNGAVTSPGSGSDHTRSELRELYTGTGADSNSDWNSAIGGTLTATGKVIAVSSHSDEATIAQIHGQSLVFMLLLCRPGSNDIAVDIYTTNTSTSTHQRTSIAPYTLGSTFTYSIQYIGNTITVTVNGNTLSFPIDSSWAGSAMYFKLGAYHAANPNYGAVPADQTQTSFSAFAVTHP